LGKVGKNISPCVQKGLYDAWNRDKPNVEGLGSNVPGTAKSSGEKKKTSGNNAKKQSDSASRRNDQEGGGEEKKDRRPRNIVAAKHGPQKAEDWQWLSDG